MGAVQKHLKREKNRTTAFALWVINVEPHKVLDDEFFPMFEILLLEFMENNLGELSNSKMDLSDLERKLQEMSPLVEDY